MTCPCPSPHPRECPWVRVREESELADGLALQLRPCSNGHMHTFNLLRRSSIRAHCVAHGFSVACGWDMIGGHCNDEDTIAVLCPTTAIREGRLYRLRDLPPEQAEETSATREKETTDV